jgi:hypothetical protein
VRPLFISFTSINFWDTETLLTQGQVVEYLA